MSPILVLLTPLCRARQWMASPQVGSDLNVFHVAKRERPFHHWEPVYIGTNREPTWDERLTWEGRADKMEQALKLCLMDYELHILDNAFLIHRCRD